MKWYLGSSSNARAAILSELFPSDSIFIFPSHVDESLPSSCFEVEELVEAKTHLKTEACLQSLAGQLFGDEEILLCGDCVCVNKDGHVREKPTSVIEANKWLDDFGSTKYIGVVQAIELTHLKTGRKACGTHRAHCVLKHAIPILGRDEYIKRAFKAAGCIVIEDAFFMHNVLTISDFRSFMGLCPSLIYELLLELNVA